MTDEEKSKIIADIRFKSYLCSSGIADTLWEQALSLIKELQSENAALHERLDKAVELPVKVGDTVYLLSQTSRCPAGEIVEAKIIDFIGWEDGYRFTAKGGGGWFSFLRGDIGTWVFTIREAALARLAELKGGKNE